MKRIAIIIVAIVLIASPLYAASITDAVRPLGHLKYSVAVEDNYIFDRDIKKPADRTKFDLEKTNQVYGKLSLGLTPYLNVYGKLGVSNGGDIKTTEPATSKEVKIETDYGFLGGFGVSGAKELSEGWKVGLDAQFNWWRVDVDKITHNGTKATNVSGKIEDFEIQGTPFVTKKFDIPIYSWTANPYLGVKFSYFRTETDKHIKYRNETSTNIESGWTLKGDNYVGIVVGSDLQINPNIALQVEGRFIDETAITAGAVYRF
ncbi:MAG: autotransporter domain-containing protein [Candidatus Omnitrophica bacterium]|nr:autotransporter domain-containing protein [Candidatus Omnitrophota bacterium]